MSTKNEQQRPSSIRLGSKSGCAEFFGVSLPTVESWVRRGMPTVQQGSRGVAWVIDLLAVAEWRFTGKAGDGEADPEEMAPSDRKAWYEGETKRRDLQVRDRELIPAGDVERVIATAFAALASDVWAIPDLLERRHGVSGELAGQVADALAPAMEALAGRLAEFAPVGPEEQQEGAE